MMDLRIRIRNKNTIEPINIYTEMPIMRESYKLKEILYTQIFFL